MKGRGEVRNLAEFAEGVVGVGDAVLGEVEAEAAEAAEDFVGEEDGWFFGSGGYRVSAKECGGSVGVGESGGETKDGSAGEEERSLERALEVGVTHVELPRLRRRDAAV